jgi:hypothetical protein
MHGLMCRSRIQVTGSLRAHGSKAGCALSFSGSRAHPADDRHGREAALPVAFAVMAASPSEPDLVVPGTKVQEGSETGPTKDTGASAFPPTLNRSSGTLPASQLAHGIVGVRRALKYGESRADPRPSGRAVLVRPAARRARADRAGHHRGYGGGPGRGVAPPWRGEGRGRRRRHRPRHGQGADLRVPGEGASAARGRRVGGRGRQARSAAQPDAGQHRAAHGPRRHGGGVLGPRHEPGRGCDRGGKRLRASAEWHFGRGPEYCGGCTA